MKGRHRKLILAGVPILAVLAVVLYQIPFVYNRVAWRVDNLTTRIRYAIHPPDEAIFVPQEPLQTAAASLPPTASPTPEGPTPQNTVQVGQETLTPTPAVTATRLPDAVQLDGVVYVKQNERWNYCGPANLAMALKFWGWDGTRDDIARAIKPGINNPDLSFIQRGRSDKNIMPSEMIDFIAENTKYNVVARFGGNLDVIKKFIANGYPVLVEKGTYREDISGRISWMGHFMFTTGYDESTGSLIVQDSLIDDDNTAEDHMNVSMDYQKYLEGWRAFNYLFMVIYPPDRHTDVYALLGPWSDPEWAYQHALKIAQEEAKTLTGIQRFFALFNVGTSLVKLQRYEEAASAYDAAYTYYPELPQDDRPWRMLWYQTWPYMAYYYSGRYQDTLNLANHTLKETISSPDLEESLYWRGLAKEALGDIDGATADLRRAVHLNKHFDAAQQELYRMQNQ